MGLPDAGISLSKNYRQKGSTMPTRDTRIVSARIKINYAEKLQKWLKDDNTTLGKFLTGIVEGKIHIGLPEGYPDLSKVEPEVMSDLTDMIEYGGGTWSRFITEIYWALYSGKIEIVRGSIEIPKQSVSGRDLSELERVCAEKNMNVDGVIKAVTEMVRRGQM